MKASTSSALVFLTTACLAVANGKPPGTAAHVVEPPEFVEAAEFYQARRYEEARAIFAGVRERYRPVANVPDNPSTRAAFHEIECLRRLGDLDGLHAALARFDKTPLTRPVQIRQVGILALWEALRVKDWQEIDRLARAYQEIPLPGDQRAQVAYCHGLALEGLGRAEDALDAHQTAMTADAGASEEIVRQAALRVMAIHLADPEVKLALENRSGPRGKARLAEAAAVASLFVKSLGGGAPLPGEFQVLLDTSDASKPGNPGDRE